MPTNVLAAMVPAMALVMAAGPGSGLSQDPAPLGVWSDPQAARPPFRFGAEDEAFLDEVQRGCWNYFVQEVDPGTGMVLDRTGAGVISVAGVGFQLAALCIADRRGWLEQGEAERWAVRIVRALHANPDNRVRGVFYHFLEPGDAGPAKRAYEKVPSTIDTAILFAGLLTAGQYFGGEVARLGDELVLGADWRSYVIDRPSLGDLDGYISLAWKPPAEGKTFNDGLYPNVWADAGDEQRLTVFMAMLADDPERAVPLGMYYRLRRTMGVTPDGRSVVWFPWSGALFTSFFAHLWIDHGGRAADDPERSGFEHRPPVDWWENARRTAAMHRDMAIRNPKGMPGFGPNLWGLTACDAEGRYSVPGLFPQLAERQAGLPGRDHLTIQAQDDWGDGTVAPYGAGATIMFEPGPAVAALRHYRALSETVAGLWDDPDAGGQGFADSFRPAPDGGIAWVAPHRVAIDAGPLLIAIENARSGLIWEVFHAHPAVRRFWPRGEPGPRSPD